MEDVEVDYFGKLIAGFQYVKDTLLAPFRIATSPPALRTYLRTALLLLTSTILFGIAVVAYTSFYYTYIPVRGISIPIYLQYDHTNALTIPSASSGSSDVPIPRPVKHPFGIANVNGLVSRQKYDVEIAVTMPRSERNLDAGNWMVGLEMRGPGTVGGGVKGLLGWEEEWDVEDYSQGGESGTAKEKTTTEQAGVVEKPVVLARSRRPAILTYRSWMTELAYRALRLPLYVIGWGQESEKVDIQMMEGVDFERGWRNVPSSVRLEIRSRAPLEIYSVVVRFVAKLEGIRWFMYRYRFTSFAVFTGMFWVVEMSVVLLTWGIFAFCFSGPSEEEDEDTETRKKIKQDSGAVTPKTEPAESEPPTPLSETPRTFPTLSSQQPLHYSSSPGEKPRIKEERRTPGLEDMPVKEEAEAEADDEDDESADFIMEEPLPSTAAGALTDSGIGTSLESSVERRSGLSRRRSGGTKDR